MQMRLDAVPLFAGLAEDELRAISEQSVTRSYPRNTIIVSAGDSADSLYVILSGRVKVFLSDDGGKEVILAIDGPGEYFGEMVLDEGPRSASVMTLEPSTFAVFQKNAFREFLLRNPVIAVALIKGLAKRLRAADEKIGDLALMDVYGRVARTLLTLATPLDGKLVVGEKLTQQALADMVGASREMISRILKELRLGGYIRMEGKTITITRKPPRAW